MKTFQFRCRAIEIEHSCRHRNEEEPDHTLKLLKCATSVVEATEGMLFHGIIKSPANSYQIDFDFDSVWIKTVNTIGWKNKPLHNLGELHNIPSIQPDVFLTQDGVTAVVEIEKSNKKTIWFDFIKILMLIGQDVADFGLLLVPRNYAHKVGVWDLFREARYYKSCLTRFAKVDHTLLSKIAIVGYTQEAYVFGKWTQLDSSVVRSIKQQVRDHFS